MKSIRKTILAATVLGALASPAYANLILFGGTAEDAFTEVGGQGFGAFPRILTLQDSPVENGATSPNGSGGTTCSGDAICNGNNKAGVVTLQTAGWATGANVGIGVNFDQQGNAGITLRELVLTIYNGTTSLGSFSLAAPITFTEDNLDLEPGNGNAMFRFVLDATQQAQYDTIRAMAGSDGFYAGLSALLGCSGSCGSFLPSNDGPDSFVTFAQPDTRCPDCEPTPHGVPGPIVGAGIPGLIAGCFTLLGLARWRRRQAVA